MAEFKMPSLGADMDAGTLVEWLVHEGDTVRRGDPIAVVDTDKSAIEVESFDDGVVEAFLVAPGTRVAVGTPLARLAPRAAEVAAPPAAALPAAAARGPDARHREKRSLHAPSPPLRHHAAELGVDLTSVRGTGPDGSVTRQDVDRAAQERQEAARVPAATAAPAAGAPATRGGRRASPYARRLARELGVDLTRVTASGPGGTVQADDVLAAREQTTEQPAPVEAPPEVPPAAARGSRATIAALMSRAKREIPHYYVASTVDLRELTEWLHRTNLARPVSERIVPAAAILKATALAARRHPELNGFWVLDEFHPADDVHLGVAVRVRDGALVAPAIHHTADLTLPELMAALRDLVKRARAGRLKRAELADPTLTVTDLGDQGVEEVIGIIYPPQVALLGVGRITERPWAVSGMLTVHPTVRLTLSGDHRATDGAAGAQFLNSIGQLLQHPEEL